MTVLAKRAMQVVSFVGLAITIGSAVLLFMGLIGRGSYMWLMFLGTILWFGTAIFWVKRDDLG